MALSKPTSTIQQMFMLEPISFTDPISRVDTEKTLENLPESPLKRQLHTLPLGVLKSVFNIGVGLEIEMENTDGRETDDFLALWSKKTDSSLRNNGMEYVTPVGIRIYNALTALDLYRTEQVRHSWSISDRTGLHVHLNIRNLTMPELNSLVILYSIVEDSLFEFIGPWRKDNIFCTPLLGSCINRQASLFAFIRQSSKYCGFNTKSVGELGTVEFRQMQTTFNSETIMRWVMILGLLKKYASQISLEDLKKEVIALKTRSNYRNFYDRIFYGFAQDLPISNETIDMAVTNSKLFFYEQEHNSLEGDF